MGDRLKYARVPLAELDKLKRAANQLDAIMTAYGMGLVQGTAEDGTRGYVDVFLDIQRERRESAR